MAASQPKAELALHQHGKSRVRVARVWRQGSVHHFVEYNVYTMLESDMAHAYYTESNRGMTATDTQKNAVYYVAKQFTSPCSPEEFGIALAQHFVRHYPLVWKAKVLGEPFRCCSQGWHRASRSTGGLMEMMPWKRLDVDGQLHEHGYTQHGEEVRTAYVTHDNQGKTEVTAGLKNFKVLKTTQSGYVGFLHDKFTTLPDVTDRLVATSVSATWKYSRPPPCYNAAYAAVKKAFCSAFFGPAKGGVYSPSVQYTLFRMGQEAIGRVEEVESVFLNMPNLHFLPVAPVTSKFEDDVYVATSEPHGNIEAVVTRPAVQPHCRL